MTLEALRLGAFEQVTDDAGVTWNWPLDAEEGQARVELAFLEDEREVWLRLPTDGSRHEAAP